MKDHDNVASDYFNLLNQYKFDIINSTTEDNNTVLSVSPESSKTGDISEQKEEKTMLPKFTYGNKITVEKA